MDNLDFLDILTLMSFVLQVENQGKLIDIRDVQKEVDRAIGEIHAHLEKQDRNIETIMRMLGDKHENN